MKSLFVFLILYIPYIYGVSQEVTQTIKGYVGTIEEGKIFLTPAINDAKYYGKNYGRDSACIKKGAFVINRKCGDNNIYPYRFVIESLHSSGATDFVLISGEDIVVEIDSIDEHVSPFVAGSSIQNEMKYDYNLFFKNLVDSVNALYAYEEGLYEKFDNSLPKDSVIMLENYHRKMMNKSDSLFQAYALAHPRSQVTLWKMIERLKNLGHRNSFNDVYRNFSEEMQNSIPGQWLKAELSEAALLRIGAVFPELQLVTDREQITSIQKSMLGRSYTLIDFWFTDCIPCRQQFPAFRQLFNSYKADGFQIIGISIDNDSKINAWKNLIIKDALNWPQMLDKNGSVTEKLGINVFPTNFLLDSNGVILQKNIALSSLQKMLMENLE